MYSSDRQLVHLPNHILTSHSRLVDLPVGFGMQVTKRNGSKEPIDIKKITKVIDWANEGLDCSVSQVELGAQIQFFEGMKTSDIHKTIVKSAADLISEEEPDYQLLAARLEMFGLRKEAYGDYPVPPLYEHLTLMAEAGLYDKHLVEDYSADEIHQLDNYLVHDRDLSFAYAAIQQFKGKYLVQDRTTGEVYESPQMAYMAIAMALFSKEKGDKRRDLVARLYDALSTFKISFPTPIMAGVRTPSRQFSSCVLIEVGDSLDSISEATKAIIKYVSQRAGIGLNTGAIRAIGSPIRNGEAEHTGKLPFLKLFQAAVKSCSQGGVRGGAATVFYPVWHLEFENLIVLKNNRGVEENRVRQLDYGVQLNKVMYERLIKGQDITFFSPSDVPGLLEAFYADQGKFEELYLQYEGDETIRKTTVPAVDVFSMIMQERAGTGRIYIQNIDHCNTHSPFDPVVAPVKQSNLCLEIALPTQPVMPDGEGEIALCTLSAFNLGLIKSNSELKNLAELQVRALDALLDYQHYLMPQAYNSTMKYRPLGIGVINYANYLAKRGLMYSDGSANGVTHRLFEAIQFHLLEASNKLAKEKYPCTGFANTRYAQGILPIDTYKKDVDSLHNEDLLLDWEGLRKEIVEHGLRNATLTALMPSETSSQISNATNGIEPPRSLVTVKQSKDGIMKQVVPGIGEIEYETYWQMARAGNKGYLELVAIMQKFVDQAISANTAYDPNQFPGGRVPMKLMLKDLMTAYKYGVKTLYYHNTRDDEVEDEDDGCAGGACKI